MKLTKKKSIEIISWAKHVKGMDSGFKDTIQGIADTVAIVFKETELQQKTLVELSLIMEGEV